MFINWSYRKRGKVALIQMKQNIQIRILKAYQKKDSENRKASADMNGSKIGPPKKTVTKTELTVIIAMYSAIKKRLKRIPLYSV